MSLTLDDLMAMDSAALMEVMHSGGALDPAALAGNRYLGVDLSLPGWARKLLWHTFRKTFHADAEGGPVRGWNVRMEQRGVDPAAEQRPLLHRHGRPRTFGHYVVRPADGVGWPKGWSGEGRHFLDYGGAGNPLFDMARLGYTPLVSVNPGSMELLLGWEIFKVAGALLPFRLFWALRADGPLPDDEVVAPPRSP